MAVISLEAYRERLPIEKTAITRAEPYESLPFIKGNNYWAVRPGKRQDAYAVGQECARRLIEFFKEGDEDDWRSSRLLLIHIVHSQQKYRQTLAARAAAAAFWLALGDFVILAAPAAPTEPDNAPWTSFWWLNEQGC
jgi:hypothetical protein